MFSKCFWSRIGSNSFFGEKSMNPVFPSRIVGVPDNASFVEEKMLRQFCFLTIGADDELRKKKNPCVTLLLMGQTLGLTYQAQQRLISFLFLFLNFDFFINTFSYIF
jgi:hypothetical protein